MSSASLGQRLTVVLAPVVQDAGFDVENVEVTGRGPRTEVRVLIDKDGGITLDDIAVATQAISTALDLPAADAILGQTPYTLEVSSPGVDRPLVEPRHWRRANGRLVRVTPVGQAELTGRVTQVDADGVRLEVVASRPTREAVPTERTFAFTDLGPGRVQVEFNRPGAIDADVDADGDADGDAVGDADGDDLDAGGPDSARADDASGSDASDGALRALAHEDSR